MIYVIFLVALLAVVVYLNRHMLGFSSGCEWNGSDEAIPGQPRKWMCMVHGTPD